MIYCERSDSPTPSGGVRSEIYYFDDAGNFADKTTATRCVIRELSDTGKLLFEIWGFLTPEKPSR